MERIGGQHLDIEALLERLVGRGGHESVPLLHVADAGQNLGLGEDLLEIGLVQPLREGAIVGYIEQEAGKVIAHQRLVVDYRRQQGGGLEGAFQIGRAPRELRPRQVIAPHVGNGARQTQVGGEEGGVVAALEAVVVEQAVERRDLERILRGRQGGGELMHGDQVFAAGGGVGPDVAVRRRSQAGKIGRHEGVVAGDIAIGALQRLANTIELDAQQFLVDGEGAEAAAVALPQLGDHQIRHALDVGQRQPQQQVAPLFGRERGARHEVQPAILEARQIAMAREGQLAKGLLGNEGGVERGGVLGGRLLLLALMVEPQAEPLTQVVERAAMVGRIFEENLAVLDLLVARRLAMTLAPLLQQWRHFCRLAAVLRMKRMIVVILLRPGNQLLERGLAPLRQGKTLLEADFGRRRRQQGRQGQKTRDANNQCSAHDCPPEE